MKTAVKLPSFLDRFLNIYTIISLSLGFLVIIMFNSTSFKDKISAAPSSHFYGSCKCKPGNLGCGFCIYNQTEEFDNYCQGFANKTGKTYIAMCWTENVLTCEELFTDTNPCNRQHENGKWAYNLCGNPIYNPKTPPPPPPPPPPGCPYSSTQAQVQPNAQSHWRSSLQLEEGQSFRVGSFHNGTGQFANDTRIAISGPGGYSFSCNTSENSGCNGYTVTGVIVGTYTVTVSTTRPRGGFYSEPECNAQATAIVDVGPPPPERSFELIKRVVGPNTYQEGDTVKFEVVITNTGQVEISDMFFSDEYSARYLRFLSVDGSVRTRRTSSIVDLTGFIEPRNPNGQFSIDDLTQQLGNLEPGSQYIIRERYVALSPNTNVRACNYAYAYWDGLEDEDEVCITIVPKDEPPTDR